MLGSIGSECHRKIGKGAGRVKTMAEGGYKRRGCRREDRCGLRGEKG